MDGDLFLDIIVLPTGEVILKDADELKTALNDGSLIHLFITHHGSEANIIKNLINKNEFDLIKLITADG